MRDLDRFELPELVETLSTIARLAPDVLALQSVDYDHNHVALTLIQARLDELGHPMPHSFARQPNAGVSTDFDLDRDDRLDEAEDRQGYGEFLGQGGLALLSRYPILETDATDFGNVIWGAWPDAKLPEGYFTEAEVASIRLHDIAAWDIPIQLPEGVVHVLMVQAGPPVFDGEENRNGLRNADQIRFWQSHLETMEMPFVLMGGLNNDPVEGEGLKPPLHSLLSSPVLQDPEPKTSGRSGPDAMDTVDWGDDIGQMRVDYVLPSAGFGVSAAAVEWHQPTGQVAHATPHKPVWVDIFWQ